MSAEPIHDPDCKWEQARCEYRWTHHYCPHPEHRCSCVPVRPGQPADKDNPRRLELAGRAAYEAFSAVNRLGDMPRWDALAPEIRENWRAVADAVLMIAALEGR